MLLFSSNTIYTIQDIYTGFNAIISNPIVKPRNFTFLFVKREATKKKSRNPYFYTYNDIPINPGLYIYRYI